MENDIETLFKRNEDINNQLDKTVYVIDSLYPSNDESITKLHIKHRTHVLLI